MEIEVEQASSVSLLAGAQCFDLLFLSWFWPVAYRSPCQLVHNNFPTKVFDLWGWNVCVCLCEDAKKRFVSGRGLSQKGTCRPQMHKILWEDRSWAEGQLIELSVLIGQKGGCGRGGGPLIKKDTDSSYMTEPSKKWAHPHHRTHGRLCIPGCSYCELLLVLLIRKTARNSASTGLYSKVNASNCDLGSVNERMKGWGVNQIVNVHLTSVFVCKSCEGRKFHSDTDEHFRQNEDY